VFDVTSSKLRRWRGKSVQTYNVLYNSEEASRQASTKKNAKATPFLKRQLRRQTSLNAQSSNISHPEYFRISYCQNDVSDYVPSPPAQI
jgi:hypothetical protein